ncbi:MAG: hypothetical protein LBS84_01640, partial [Clostridiales bacterium]|nr:hypothetical protein [Clostridiales bacterium]
LSPALKYTWYRFRIPFAQEPVSFESVELYYSKTVWSQINFIEQFSPDYSMGRDGEKSVITLKNLKNLPITGITLKTESMFKRLVSGRDSQKYLFNLRFGDSAYQDLTLPTHGYASDTDDLSLYIDDNDDSPIKVDGIDIEYHAARLVFEAPETETLYLYYGNPEIDSPPGYDIANYMDLVLEQGYETLSLGKPEVLETASEPARDYSVYYNIVITVTAAALIIVIVLRLQKVNKNNPE